MKILIINVTDGGGGGAIAPLLLFKKLREAGVDVDFGVIKKTSTDNAIFSLQQKKGMFQKVKVFLLRAFFKLFRVLFFKTSNNILHSFNLWSIIDVDAINNSDYDLVHLHWIGGNAISIKDVGRINKPLIWTMHDSWPVCGAEHHPDIFMNDTRYRDGYTKKNKLATTKGFDLCRHVFNLKKKYYKTPIHFIGPSNWQTNICKDSVIFKHLQGSTTQCIPNVLDESIFRQIDKQIARKNFNLPMDKKILMFASPYSAKLDNDMKGSKLLLEALKMFFSRHNIEEYRCLIVGNVTNEVLEKLPKGLEAISTGFISDRAKMNEAYNTADCLLFPSRIENLPYGCLEPQSSGIPVVAFDVGGISDIVQHKNTGYLANPYNTEEFATGIEFCLEHQQELSRNAIEFCHKNFYYKDVIKKHIELYKQVLKN